MSEHLSLDELVKFIGAKKVDSEFFSLAARVNSHIRKCDACRQEYNTLLAIDHSISRLSVQKDTYAAGDNQIASMLTQAKGYLQKAGLTITSLKKGWGTLKLRVESLRALECEMAESVFELYHPPYLAAAKSVSKTGSDRPVQPAMIKSTLTDGQGSRISVGEDGTLSFFLANDGDMQNSLVALFPESPDGTAQFGKLGICDKKTLSVHFDDILPGEYFAMVFRAEPSPA